MVEAFSIIKGVTKFEKLAGREGRFTPADPLQGLPTLPASQ